ncbi:MAG TPA: hypothetical protein VGD05_07600 [Pyrinomonadaceae bacterium]|jgi:hypothetical protein
MAEKKPLCNYAGVTKELQSGDTLPGAALDNVPTNGSNNGVTSNGVFDAIAQTIQRLSSTVVNTNTTSKQPLYTVPTGKKLIPDKIVLHSPSIPIETIAYGAVLYFDNDYFAEMSMGYLQEFFSTAHFRSFGYADAGYLGGSSADVLAIAFGGTSFVATITVDVFGYLVDA